MGNSGSTEQEFERYDAEEEEPPRATKKPPKGRSKHRQVATPNDEPIIEEPDNDGPNQVRAETIYPIEEPAGNQDRYESEKYNHTTKTHVNQPKRPPPITTRPRPIETHSNAHVSHDTNRSQDLRHYDSERIEYTSYNRDYRPMKINSQKTLIKRSDKENNARQRPMEKPKGFVIVRREHNYDHADRPKLTDNEPKTNVSYSNQTGTNSNKPMSMVNAQDRDNDTSGDSDNVATQNVVHHDNRVLWMP